ncbi:hypothetical protein TWF506_009741 [Arthrobotrys conoides]|uniref:Uncharacterized protein n=1 Tax=Arthrobotrys conoides TaxID=74498 RepID=A0AAN8PCX2_9PEZI
MWLSRSYPPPPTTPNPGLIRESQDLIILDAAADAKIDTTADATADTTADTIADATIYPIFDRVDVTVDVTADATVSATADSNTAADDRPDIFWITLGAPSYLEAAGLEAPDMELSHLDSSASRISNDKSIHDIQTAVYQRYWRYDRIMDLTRNGRVYQKLGCGLLQGIYAANSYFEVFLKHLASKSQAPLPLPFLDTITYRLIQRSVVNLNRFQRRSQQVCDQIQQMEHQFDEISQELVDFHEGHEDMKSKYLAGDSAQLLTDKDREDVDRFFKEIHKDLVRRTDRFIETMEWIEVIHGAWDVFQTGKLMLEQSLETLLKDVDFSQQKGKSKASGTASVPLVHYDKYKSGSFCV